MAKKHRKLINETKIYQTFIISTSLVILLVVSGIFLGIALRTRHLIQQENLIRAREDFSNIVLTRRWNAHYGGVFVEKKEGVESNPYLVNPDIKTIDGKIYTKRNPALMTREISEIANEAQGFKFHITSLNLLNPNNQPDTFERNALHAFEQGAKEIYKTVDIKNRMYFRYMAPLYVEQACLQCHVKQGYIVGDVRGGISVMFDIAEIQHRLLMTNLAMFFFAITTTASLLGLVYYFMRRLVNQLTVARAEIERIAITDGLTGLYTRRYTMLRFREELERAKRYRKQLTCIILDIDHFKNVNDTYGHLVGDEVLIHLAQLLKRLRSFDILGRYGGEEFLIILPETDFIVAKVIAERIRVSVAETPMQKHTITVSLGLTSLQEQDTSVDTILKRADDALYKVKHAGRNRVDWL
jgi:diguanylate cyclase (GGDEF)-like protein